MLPILEARNLSKEYKLGGAVRRTENFREALLRNIKRPFQSRAAKEEETRQRHFWALRDLNFDVFQGDVLGVIGRNGAGKSTLLKIMSRITDPTEGEIKLRGRMASLLEVGTGFHPELTGRENIFMNGAILGMRRAEIVAKFDEIVAFSEIENFLDTPVKHYSSGMYVKLAFSVAAHLDPEILVVDEVLAVGDMAFQKKCLGKMSEVSQGGRTVLFVSHNMPAVENLCRRGLVLNHGKLVFDGTGKDAVEFYLRSVSGEGSSGHVIDLAGAHRVEAARPRLLERLEFYTAGNEPLNGSLPMGNPLRIYVHFKLPRPTHQFNVGIGFDNMFGQRVFTAHSYFEPHRSEEDRVGTQVFVCNIPSLTLVSGEYTIRVWLDIREEEVDLIDDAARLHIIDSDYYRTGRVPWNGVFVLPHNWYLEKAGAAT
ncbi:MAG: ABC transporter ATP-binding protein [Acidobacteriota bacterium]|nr:ABC transporter ATP-binding protein [Acidobacteriota bacterium]